MSKLEIPKCMNYLCLVCDKELELDDNCSRTINAPVDRAVMFSTTGNWGSQVWDCSGRAYGAICDECFILKSTNMLVVEYEEPEKVQKLSTVMLKWYEWLKTQPKQVESFERVGLKTVLSYFPALLRKVNTGK